LETSRCLYDGLYILPAELLFALHLAHLFYVCVDSVMPLGVARDLLVDRRVHKVYLYGIPALAIGQSVAIYLWRGSPGWWLSSCKEILGI
jgi:hypothetical protein